MGSKGGLAGANLHVSAMQLRGGLARLDMVLAFVDAWFELDVFVCGWKGGLAGANLHVGAM